MVFGYQVRGQRVVALVHFMKHDDPATGPPPGQEEQHPVLVRRHSSKQVQLNVIGKEHLQVGQDQDTLAGEIGAQEPLEGLGHMRCGGFGSFGLILRELLELLVRYGIQDAPVHVDGFREGGPVRGLGLMQFLGETLKLTVGAQNAV